jgi:hypothetical protein
MKNASLMAAATLIALGLAQAGFADGKGGADRRRRS